MHIVITEIEHRKDNKKDIELIFYRDLLDQIHFHLLHLWDHGFRKQDNNNKKENKTDNIDNGRYKHNKFQIYSQKASYTQQFSLYDFICKLLKENNEMTPIKWLNDEEFDSDSLRDDVDVVDRNGINGSNLNNNHQIKYTISYAGKHVSCSMYVTLLLF